ncbi:hypothetical protein ACFE04_023502 [Oxalis oulophora]
MNQEYQCFVGRNGMPGVEEEYMEKYGVMPERHESWKFARMNSKGEFVDHRTQIVAERIDELKVHRESGELKLKNDENILLKALGRNQKSGHMLARGPIASSKKSGKQQKDPSAIEKELSASQKRIDALEEEIVLLRKSQEPYISKFETEDNDINEEAAKDDNHKQSETNFESEGPNASNMNDFTNPLLFGESFPHKYSPTPYLHPSWLDTERSGGVPNYSEEKDCLLYALVDGIRNLVPIDRVVADGAATNEIVHFKVLSSGNYKVKIKYEIIGSAKVPIPGGEIELVRDVVQSFIA